MKDDAEIRLLVDEIVGCADEIDGGQLDARVLCERLILLVQEQAAKSPVIHHSLRLHFRRVLSESEWRKVVKYARRAPYVHDLEAQAMTLTHGYGCPYDGDPLRDPRPTECPCDEQGSVPVVAGQEPITP